MNISKQTETRTEDASLLAKFVVEGDEEAIARLVSKYQSLVWNVCCRVLNNRWDAEDAFQATFMLLATRAHRIRKPKSLSSWLYGAAYRTASSIRKQRHRDFLSYEASTDPRADRDVLEEVAKKNENELVSAELMLLKEAYRTPLLMFYFLGQSSCQIASSLDLSVAAVESRLRRAKAVMKHRLRLRGIDLGASYTALALPVMAISPNLVSTTLSGITAASMVRGLSHWLANALSTVQQTGAKLMLVKTLVSFSIIGLFSIGFVSHGASGLGGITVVEGAGQNLSLPIKFVSEEEEEVETSVLRNFHSHVRDVWWNVHDHFFGSTDRELRLQLEPLPPADVEKLGVQLEWTHDDRFSFEIDTDPNVENEVVYGVLVDVEEDEAVEGIFVANAVWSPQKASDERRKTALPKLSDIPIIGQLFEAQPLTEEVELFVVEGSGVSGTETTETPNDKK